jgi:hypothetical protein
LLGQQKRVAQTGGSDIHAEFEAPGRAGQGRHHAHAFQMRVFGDDAVGLPDGIDAAVLA